MKNKISTKYFFCITFALAISISIGCHLFATPSTTYALDAEGSPETFEEFQEQINDVYTKRDELIKMLKTIKEYDDIKTYQEIWDVLERYAATEEIGTWWQSGPPFNAHYRAGSFGYNGEILQELTATIQKYDPNFKLADDIKDNNIISSLSNITIPEVATVIYNTLYTSHINFMLANAQTHFNKNANYVIGRTNMVANFLTSVNEQFENGFLLYDYTSEIAELYNRILSRDAFADVQAIFQQWQKDYANTCLQLRTTTHILQHGEELTSFRYFSTAGGPPFAPIYLGTSIASKFQETYTLEQLVNYLPSHNSFPGIDKDETIAFFTSILKAEVKNLKETLIELDPTLANLDDKTVDNLLEISEQHKDINMLFQNVFQNADPKTQQLASLLIQFNFETLNMLIDQYPADKYFAQPTLMTLAATPTDNTLTIEQINNQKPSNEELYNLYGRLGNAALQIDPTITEGLHPHPDWEFPETPDTPEVPETPVGPINPDDQDPQPTPEEPSAPSQEPSENLTPNTGIIGDIVNSATSTTGIIVISSVVAVIFVKKFLRHAAKR